MATIGEDHLPQKNSVSTEERVATENTASARREVRGSFRDTPDLKTCQLSLALSLGHI